MSHPSHIDHLHMARNAGFETRLIFVATDDPRTNIGRVADRVTTGGHDVPIDRIANRYAKSLALLPAAIKAADRAMIFDNSDRMAPFRLVVTIRGDAVNRHTLPLPQWLQPALEALKI
jgi:predicted ABC-type ATPase